MLTSVLAENQSKKDNVEKKPAHIASLPFEDIVNWEGTLFNTNIFVIYKLYFEVSPITNPSCEAYFKAAYTNCQLKFACSRVNKN